MAFASRAVGMTWRGCGLMSEVRGRFWSDRRLSVGSSGFASTLAMKIAVTAVIVIPSAR